jgi:hypothetical protein
MRAVCSTFIWSTAMPAIGLDYRQNMLLPHNCIQKYVTLITKGVFDNISLFVIQQLYQTLDINVYEGQNPSLEVFFIIAQKNQQKSIKNVAESSNSCKT